MVQQGVSAAQWQSNHFHHLLVFIMEMVKCSYYLLFIAILFYETQKSYFNGKLLTSVTKKDGIVAECVITIVFFMTSLPRVLIPTEHKFAQIFLLKSQ